MYRPAPDLKGLADMGLRLDDFPLEIIEVWPENVTAFRVFPSLRTQWTSSGAGAIGLNYSSLPFVFDMHGIPAEDRPDLFEQIKVMENGALMSINTK